MSSLISNIKIRNIKGYGDPAIQLPIELKSNRINIIFAPNGTGKSSFATAFKSLNSVRLDVAKDDKYLKDEFSQSELSLDLDGVNLIANKTINTISGKICCQVINCTLFAHALAQNRGRFNSVTKYLDIHDISITKVVPSHSIGYTITNMRSLFKNNGKILPNLSQDVSSYQCLNSIKSIWSQMDSFVRAQYRMAKVQQIITYLERLQGTAEQINASFDEIQLQAIEQEEIYQRIMDELGYFSTSSKLTKFLIFYQLLQLWLTHRVDVQKATERAKYEMFRNKIDENLELLDTTWKGIRTEESSGNLIVRFPHADEISNGQRDLLTFLVEIIKFQSMLDERKKYLLIIDELFDYLDDANLITTQFYLSSLLKKSYDNLFLCIMSHLNPYTFRTYIFSKDKLNIQYLKDTRPRAEDKTKAFIAFRGSLDKNDTTQKSLYDDLSNYLFHYNPTTVDYKSRVAAYIKDQHLDMSWFITQNLHQVLIDEVNKYLSDQATYDPYVVAMALRLRVEKCMYNKLPTEHQSEFLDQHLTRDKFDYCLRIGISVPDVYYIISAIHNEADHVKYDVNEHQYIEKPMVYKLQNNMIKFVIKKIFEWPDSAPLSTNAID